MNMNLHWITMFLLLLNITAQVKQINIYGTAYAVEPVTYEKPDSRNSSQILGKEIIKGPLYSIREKVITYGYMHHYTVDSQYGIFEVAGDHSLLKLLNEISAISELKKIQDTDAYVEAVKQAGMAPINFGVSMINDPVDTVSAVPKGAFSVLKNISSGLTSDDDPAEDSTAKQLLAVSSTKRQYAHQLGVDVYSSNAVLQKELNRVGWAGAIGGLSVSIATIPIGGAAVTVIKSAKLADDIRNSLRDEPPSKLREINKAKLFEIGVTEEFSEKFLSHPDYTPWHDTIISASLSRLGGISGINNFVEFAIGAEDEVDANFATDIAQTIANYHASVSHIKNIRRAGNVLIIQATNGKSVIPFPLDHGVWTERAEKFFDSIIIDNPDYRGNLEFWTTGTLSHRAKNELSKRNIGYREDIDNKFVYIY